MWDGSWRPSTYLLTASLRTPAWTQPYFDEAVGAFQGEAMHVGRRPVDGPSHLRRHEPRRGRRWATTRRRAGTS